MKTKIFSVWVDGFPECFVEASTRSKAKAIAARSLINANYAYNFFEAIRMIRKCRLSNEYRYSTYVLEHLLNDH